MTIHILNIAKLFKDFHEVLLILNSLILTNLVQMGFPKAFPIGDSGRYSYSAFLSPSNFKYEILFGYPL